MPKTVNTLFQTGVPMQIKKGTIDKCTKYLIHSPCMHLKELVLHVDIYL